MAEYLPDGQFKQAESAIKYLPTPQELEQEELTVEIFEKKQKGHESHRGLWLRGSINLLAAEYCPEGQLMKEEEPVRQYEPAGQDEEQIVALPVDKE